MDQVKVSQSKGAEPSQNSCVAEYATREELIALRKETESALGRLILMQAGHGIEADVLLHRFCETFVKREELAALICDIHERRKE